MSIAFHLARLGSKHVLVLERDALGSGATGRSSGIVRQNYADPVLAKMAFDSLQVFRSFRESIGGDAEFANTGYLVASSDGERLSRRVRALSALGIEVRLLSGRQAKEMEPELEAGDDAPFAYEEDAGVANATSTLLSYAHQAKKLGVVFKEKEPVTEVRAPGGKVDGVKTTLSEYTAPVVVDAAGAWSGRVASMAGVSIPVRPVVRHMVRVVCPGEMKRPELILLDEDLDVYVLPEGRTSSILMIGGGAETHPLEGTDEGDPDSYAQRVPEGVKIERVRRAAVRYPKLLDAPVAGDYTGIVDYTPDRLPILSATDGVEGLFFACGSSSHGFKLTPMVGKAMAELVLDGSTRSTDIAHFALTRFGDLTERVKRK